jgi:hypothetical protein
VLAGIEDRLMPDVVASGIRERLPICDSVDKALKRFGLVMDHNRWRIQAVRAD